MKSEFTLEGMKVTTTVRYRIDWERGLIEWCGVVLPFKVINQDCIQVGNTLFFRGGTEVFDVNTIFGKIGR